MKIGKTKAIFLFLFMPKRFNKLSVEYHKYYINESKRKYGGASTGFNISESKKNNAAQAVLLRQSLLVSLGAVSIALILSIITSYYFVCCKILVSPLAIMALQWTGGFIILGATLWEIGNARSACGEWLAEKVHKWIFRILYIFGTFLLGVGVGIDGISNTILP